MLVRSAMGARTHKELVAWQLADGLRREIYALMSQGRAATDRRFRSNGEDAAGSTCRNLAEGFGRFNPREFALYARYSAASNREVGDVIDDGVARRYWTPKEAEKAQNLQIRTGIALARLRQYLKSKAAKENAERIERTKDGKAKNPNLV
jgi:four helix bundle protein